jgi:glycerol-3-phosphate acyltransferase PlsY
MGALLAVILAFTSAYIIGSFPTSFVMARVLKGVDIRKAGSGNVGATNVYRVVGKIPGLLTLIVDIAKGVLAVTLIAGYFYRYTVNLDFGIYRTSLGLAVISGHIWSVFLGFSGGKGVATTIGVMAVIAPGVLALSLGIWLIAYMFSKYVSLASIAMGLAFPIFASILSQPIYLVIFSVILCAITSYKHKGNIKRLLRGEESKTIIFKSR